MIDCKFDIASMKSTMTFDVQKANAPKTNFACLYWVHSQLGYTKGMSRPKIIHMTPL
jgi:hypothetical protein